MAEINDLELLQFVAATDTDFSPMSGAFWDFCLKNKILISSKSINALRSKFARLFRNLEKFGLSEDQRSAIIAKVKTPPIQVVNERKQCELDLKVTSSSILPNQEVVETGCPGFSEEDFKIHASSVHLWHVKCLSMLVAEEMQIKSSVADVSNSLGFPIQVVNKLLQEIFDCCNDRDETKRGYARLIKRYVNLVKEMLHERKTPNDRIAMKGHNAVSYCSSTDVGFSALKDTLDFETGPPRSWLLDQCQYFDEIIIQELRQLVNIEGLPVSAEETWRIVGQKIMIKEYNAKMAHMDVCAIAELKGLEEPTFVGCPEKIDLLKLYHQQFVPLKRRFMKHILPRFPEFQNTVIDSALFGAKAETPKSGSAEVFHKSTANLLVSYSTSNSRTPYVQTPSRRTYTHALDPPKYRPGIYRSPKVLHLS